MRKIVLIDPEARCVDYILENSQSKICVLVVNSEEARTPYLNMQRIEKIMTSKEFGQLQSVQNLKISDLKEMKGLQHDVENLLNRATSDYQERKRIYFTSLSFWNEVFSKNDIQAVIINGLNHGGPSDGIPFALALKRGIKVYTMDPVSAEKRVLWEHLDNRFIKVHNLEEINFENSKFYSVDVNANDSPTLARQSKINKILAAIMYKLFGFLGLEFGYCILNKNFSKLVTGTGVSYNFWEKLVSYWRIKLNQKKLKELEELANLEKKFVFYALHLEPEGSLMARVSLDSQWCAIKMIEESLPDGWEVYVKEHPHQFEINNWERNGYILNGHIFKSIKFYEKLAEMDKVKIIDRQTKSVDLIQNSQAVATMNGTIALEAVDYRKPVLLFAGETLPLALCEDYFKINSVLECKDALGKIQNGFVPEYKHVSEIQKDYYVEETEEGYNTMLNEILKNM